MVELARRLANVVRPGVVAEADYSRARVRVKYGEEDAALSAWLPFLAARAGGDKTWWAPEIGEQVVILAPSGELHNGFVLGALYSTASPAPSDDPDKEITVFSDGTRVEYDRAAHKLLIEADVEIAGDVTITGDVDISGGAAAGAQVEDGLGTMNGIREIFNGHTHGAAPADSVPGPNERMG